MDDDDARGSDIPGEPGGQGGGNPPPLTVPRLLRRGATLRCPLCGGGGLFHNWFHIRERCLRCNFSMERIEGHWIGSLGLNVIVSFTALFLTIGVGVALTQPHVPAGPLVVVAVAVAGLLPVLFFPFSKTLWTAIDLAMRPLEPDDEVDPRWIPPTRHHE